MLLDHPIDLYNLLCRLQTCDWLSALFFQLCSCLVVCSSTATAPIFSGRAQSLAQPVSLVLVPLVRNFLLLHDEDMQLMGCRLHFLHEQA